MSVLNWITKKKVRKKEKKVFTNPLEICGKLDYGLQKEELRKKVVAVNWVSNFNGWIIIPSTTYH